MTPPFPNSGSVDFDDAGALDSCLTASDVEQLDLTGLPDSVVSSIDGQIAQIEMDLKKVHLLALSFRTPFFDEVVERRKNKEKGSDIGVRVRRSGFALEISYYRSAFRVRTGGKRITKSIFIRKSQEYRYGARDLSGLQSWEKELILEFEEVFSHCRKSSRQLVAARRALRNAKKSISEAF
ncbi:conjugative transfer protein MobI(A/C) [Stutzerimonas xanthomarina]|uniref:conjugative transfer protein MobI(A/C) n=1 Tax=Stutzerimonas xanthomarina TaxID=271420 RepID=UPI003AA8323E